MNILKIDRIFIKDLIGNPRDEVMLGTILDMAHALDLQVVAEGVEELGQLQVLASLGCDMVQGFYFSTAVPGTEIPGLLSRCYLPDIGPYANQAG